MKRFIAAAIVVGAALVGTPAHAQDLACANVYVLGFRTAPLNCAPGSAIVRATVVVKTGYVGAGVDSAAAVAVRVGALVPDAAAIADGTGVGTWFLGNPLICIPFPSVAMGIGPGTCPIYPEQP
jgi:hypothetical protein